MKIFVQSSLLLVFTMFFFFGCITESQPMLQRDLESKVTIGRIAGRHTGNQLVKKYPDIAKEVLIVCKNIMEENDPDIFVTLVCSVTDALVDECITDSLLRADAKDILDMINIQPGIEVSEEQTAAIKAVAEGLISGITF